MTISPASAQVIERASVGGDGRQSSAPSIEQALSADGRVVAFVTTAGDLVPGCPGRLYVHDRAAGTITCIQALGGDLPSPALSADGRLVAFRHTIGGGATPPQVQTFVYDRATGATEMVSVASDGTPATTTTARRDTTTRPAISADGRFVAFGSDATNLGRPPTAPCSSGLNIFLHDRLTGETAWVSRTNDGACTGTTAFAGPTMSADGRVVAWSGPPGPPAIWVRDLTTGQTTGPLPGIHPALSADGRVLAFATFNGDLFVHDRAAGTTTRLGVTCPASPCQPALSGDGRLVAFVSSAGNLVPGDTNGVADVFVHDRLTGQTRRVNVVSGGTQANGGSSAVALSADGATVAFTSEASNLVSGDTNGVSDVFIATLRHGDPSLPTPLTGRFAGGVYVAAADLDGDGIPEIVTGAGAGGGPHVRTFALNGAPLPVSFFAYNAAFTGGVRVAACDFDGDGRAEIVVGPGPGGGPHVRVFKVDAAQAAPLAELASFYAYDPHFTGGVYVACGDLDGDGVPEIVTGAGEGGGPHVRAFRYTSPGVTPAGVDFFAYAPTFSGGVRVAVGDADGAGGPEIITGAGPGGGPHVQAFRFQAGARGGVVATAVNFFAYAPAFTGGVFVAAVPGGGPGLVTGADAGGGPHVRLWTLSGGVPVEQTGFYGYDAGFVGGVRVTMAPGLIVTGPGAGGGPHVRAFSTAGIDTGTSFFAY